jgi:hypothetical protein
MEFGALASLAWAKSGSFFHVSADAHGWRVDEYNTFCRCVRVVSRPATLSGARRSVATRNRKLI